VKILVDADSCPRPARDLTLRAAARTGVPALFAANRPLPGIPGECMVVCPPREGAADDRLVELARPGDLAVTRDLPLAERLVDARVHVLDDRGRAFTPENIRERRSLRDFMVSLAADGLAPERARTYGKKDLKSFADSLERALRRPVSKGERHANFQR